MQLVQLLLPLHGADRGEGGVRRGALPRQRRGLFEAVLQELTARFGGVTAYARAPATGLWRAPGRSPRRAVREDIVVVEVMVARLDARWWARYRRALEARFGQQEIVLRAQAMRRL